MAQLSTVLSLNTAPTSRSASPKAPLPQSDKRPPEKPEAPEPASSVTKSANEQIPVKAEKTRFEKLLDEGKREQTDEQAPANATATESQAVPAQEPAFNVLGLFGGNPLPLEGQTLPLAAGTAIPESVVAGAVKQESVLAASVTPLDEQAASGLTAAGLPDAAPTSLLASPPSPPTLFHSDGSASSLFADQPLAGAPLQPSSTQPAASLFAAPAAASMLAANDATSPTGLSLPQPAADGAVVPSDLQEIMGSAQKELTTGLTGGLTSAVANSTPQPGAQPALPEGATGVAPPVPSVTADSGAAALTTPAQPDPINPLDQPAARIEISSDSVSTTPVEAASAVLPEANVSEAAATAQAVTETANAQEQVAESAWQPDAAERARAWRGISTLDPASGLVQGSGQGLVQAGRHEFSVNYTSAAGQFQQFAEALRQAGSGAEAGLASAGAQSSLQTAPQSAVTSTTLQATDRGTNAVNTGAPGPESQQAWRMDSIATGVTASGSRGAAGTLSFTQGMQGSSFGQPLGQSFGDSEWAESVTKRVALMAGQKVSSAQIELDPPELGAMTVRISVTGDQANVMFTSAHAQVREALEQTFPQLQDMLGQQGLQLADAQVSDQSAARQQQGEGRGGAGQWWHDCR
ncbi:MAG: flagellar hook-length control protein FliK [Gammaproteobacteria bacterium]|nr:flagellar hook-length control protein FliK [Gammaproteobacteria bacterium]